jgi:hypothetical protein
LWVKGLEEERRGMREEADLVGCMLTPTYVGKEGVFHQ